MVIERIQIEKTPAAVRSVIIAREMRRHLNRATDFNGRGAEEGIAGKALHEIFDTCDGTLRNVVPNEAGNPSAQMNPVYKLWKRRKRAWKTKPFEGARDFVL